jgi:hypothetical protein
MLKSVSCFMSMCLLSLAINLHAETIIQYTPLEDPADKRLDYILAVLDLAMSKTQQKYGVYRFNQIPRPLTLARSVHELNRDTYSNYFLVGGHNIQLLGAVNLISVDYPVDHGLLSYRICFVSPNAKEKVAQAKSLDELLKFSIGQGANWSDVQILESNGFRVVQIANYASMFKVVMADRVDLLCRGVSELRRELNAYKKLGDLQYDESFALFYQLPYMLYFNKNSQAVVNRIEEGLAIAQKDGTLPTLFLHYFREDIQFAHLERRRIFYLKNPYVKPMSNIYNSYIINPTKPQ